MEADSREDTPTRRILRVRRHRARHKICLRSTPAGTKKKEMRKSRRRTRLKASELTPRCYASHQTLPPKSTRCNSLAVSVILFYFLLELSPKLALPNGSSLLTSADEPLPSQSIEPQPEAQPLIFMLPEMGSGDGSRKSHSRTSTSFSIDPSSSVTDADMAPALIEARCWNNYENDNDCKQLNVISAPQGEDRNTQQQDDSIITPVVIFEASSSVEPPLDNQIESERPVFMAPPYQSNEIPQRINTANTKKHKQQPERPQTSTSSYAATPRISETNFDSPTPPSVAHHVVTPQSTIPSGQESISTTTDRKCRDENDEDCDDDEDNSFRGPPQSGPANDSDKNEEDDDGDEDNGQDSGGKHRTNPVGTDSTDDQSNLIGEPGSGLGPGGGQTDDDTDDSKDDGEAETSEEIGESSGASSIQENTSQSSDGRLFVISSSYSPQATIDITLKPDSGAEAQQVPITTTSRPASWRPQSGAAEIEVVVHSTLPPSFPGQNQNGGRSKGPHGVLITNFETTSSTTTTTIMPTEEIVTSRPTFPSTTVDNSPTIPPESSDNERFPSAVRTNQTAPTTTEADLFTFKPIPIPVETETRPTRFDSFNSKQEIQTGGSTKPGIGSQHIHEPFDRRPFDYGWTTRKPQSSISGLAGSNPLANPSDLLASGSRMQPKSKAIYMPTETLPTMLLYASIIVTVFISLILVVIYSLWRRNSLRRRALLAKAHMMNGRAPAGMIESMSHVSHLMHGPDGMPPQQTPQQGLLSTYASTKGSTMGKVTTSLVKPIDQSESGLLDQGLDDEDEDGDDDDREQVFKDSSKDELANGVEDSSLEGAQNPHQLQSSRLTDGINQPMHNRSGSWSTEDPTTTTSSGSQRTQDSQVNLQQRQLTQNSPHSRHPYPNSLSDGRQNSSSMSDSQCSPDPQPSSSLAIGPLQHPSQPLRPAPNQPLHMLSPVHSNNQHMLASQAHLAGHNQQAYELHQRHQLQSQPHVIRPILRSAHANGTPRMGPGPSLMPPAGIQPHQMMGQDNSHIDGFKHRLVASRSIEDIPLSQHNDFINSNNNHQYLPYNQHQQVGPPHLIRAKPLYPHPGTHVAVNSSPTFRNSLISPQRIAMSPLATLSRRIPPGAGLNRNVYSEDSSSFITASPSLARTSSSSSFAFNLSNLPTPSSIKARHIVDNSGRVFNDYTPGLSDHANGSSTDTSAVATGPPVFAQGARSEHWYV